MKNVLIVESSTVGGHAHYVALMANHLKRYCNVFVLGTKGSELEHILEVQFLTGPIFKHIKEKNIDIVHLFMSYPPHKTLLFLLYNKLFLKKKVVYTVHNLERHEKHWLKSPIIKYTQEMVFLFADRIIVQNSVTKKALGNHKEKLRLVHHGNYLWFDRKKYTRQSAREKLGFKDEFVVLFFGAIRPYKGVEYLVDAVRGIKNTSLLIVGKVWPDMAGYFDKVKNEPFIRLVDDLVPNEDVELYYKASDAAVCPYVHVSTSGPIQIAISLKVPLIATDVDSMPEIVGDVALLVPPKDRKAIKKAILKLQKNKKLREKLIDKGYTKASVDYSWERMAEKVYKVYTR